MRKFWVNLKIKSRNSTRKLKNKKIATKPSTESLTLLDFLNWSQRFSENLSKKTTFNS